MKKQYPISRGEYYPPGVTKTERGIQFVWEAFSGRPCEIAFYRGNKELVRIPVADAYRIGSLYAVCLEELPDGADSYAYLEGGERMEDVYTGQVLGMRRYGHVKGGLRYALPEREYDWEGDEPLSIPYEESLFYGLHVRGFTRHASSGVEKKGTFAGIMEKIPYLQDLGVTAVELMPCWEFDEMEKEENAFDREEKPRLNYWGYRKGFYFAPKSAYAYGEDCVTEVKDLVKALHKAGLEVILQFYFPKEIKRSYVVEVIKHWVLVYHIDGVHLLGENLPLEVLAQEPLLQRTKLLHDSFPLERLYGGRESLDFRHLGCFSDGFKKDMRRYVKGDEGCLSQALYQMRNNSSLTGIVNSVADYNGFTLADLVSYERKHNEANGEDNQDGTDYNFSWNCGAEGPSRKKAVMALRKKQIKNALTLLFLSQGTPYLQSGDEFGQTQKGNNNPYCQDNAITWLNWGLLEKNREQYDFVKELIAFRRSHPVFHQAAPLRLIDYLGCGYPDLSYHGEEVWKAALENYNRHVGVMYCGQYGRVNREEDDYFYGALNAHWEGHPFALPRLPKGMEWQLCLDTSREEAFVPEGERTEADEEHKQTVKVAGRTICLYRSVKKTKKGER